MERTEKLLAELQREKQFEVVSVDYVKEAGTWYLRVLYDMSGSIGIEDCAEISHTAFAWPDREDFIPDGYVLGASSPGLSRSLKKEKDLMREKGKDMESKFFRPLDGQKESSSVLLGHTTETITLQSEEGERIFQCNGTVGTRLAPKFQGANLEDTTEVIRETSKEPAESGNELKEVIELFGREKNINKDSLLEAIQSSLLSAYKNGYGTSDNMRVYTDRDSYRYRVVQKKVVVEELPSKVRADKRLLYISLADVRMIDPHCEIDDVVPVEVKSQEFSRIATDIAKSVILQKIREEEWKVIYNDHFGKEHNLVIGIMQRLNVNGNSIPVSLRGCGTVLSESEQVKGEVFHPTDYIKLYVVEAKGMSKGPRIAVSRTHPDLVCRLFEQEVSGVKGDTVEIKIIVRETGSRTKTAVYSNDENVDPAGTCVGVNYARVSVVVDELHSGKTDIIKWDNDPALLTENALSPVEVILVPADGEDKEAIVIVPDYQFLLAIGEEGQSVCLVAKLTGYKIDIRPETQAREEGLFGEYGTDYQAGGAGDNAEGQSGEEEV